jgi:hypothetical protein
MAVSTQRPVVGNLYLVFHKDICLEKLTIDGVNQGDGIRSSRMTESRIIAVTQ